MHGPSLFLGALYTSLRGVEDESKVFRSFYAMMTAPLRAINPDWNNDKHDFNQEFFLGSVAVVALMMSQSGQEFSDSHYPDLSWGKGKWPSFSQAMDRYMHQVIYGWKFPDKIGISSF